MRRGWIAATLVGALCALLGHAPGAAASSTQESMLQDDSLLVFGTPEGVDGTMSTLRSLGVDRVRVSVLWRLVAPNAADRARPAFGAGGASDPAAYPSGAWTRYDRIVEVGRKYGIALLFSITGPGPTWASSDPARGQGMYDPRPSDFRDFVTAVGRRYSGSYATGSTASPPPPSGGLLPIFQPPPPPAPPVGSTVLPRVDFWSIWNEPNQPGWLRPQTVSGVPSSPRLYRSLLDAGFAGLGASGHGGDTILLAETAPRGSIRSTPVSPMRPLLFIRELYCLDRRLRPYTGGAAAVRGCPVDRAARLRFASEHPALFEASGWAHHPYALELAPSQRDPVADNVTLSGISRLTGTLDRIFRRYGQRRRLPIWLTEYGYQTDPPDPIIGVSWRRQAAYLNEAEEIAYRNPRVRGLSQFLLVDDGPNTKVAPSDPRYWGSTFQSGLIALDGRRKPAFFSYQRTIDVTPGRARRGRLLRVFGQLRPAPNGALLQARIQFKRRGGSRWSTVRRVETRSFRNYLVAHVRARSTGYWRIAWGAGPSRAVYVRVR
jgi:hypothetical protein